MSPKEYYDSIAAMVRKTMHMARVFFLLLYVLYAVTPVHMYAMAGDRGRGADLLHPRSHASKDIVWANILFSSFLDDDEAPSCDRVYVDARQGGDVVLVKKRRAVFRGQFAFKPLFDMKSLPPAGHARPAVRSLEYEIAKDPLLGETGSCFTLNSGLSPPSLLS